MFHFSVKVTVDRWFLYLQPCFPKQFSQAAKAREKSSRLIQPLSNNQFSLGKFSNSYLFFKSIVHIFSPFVILLCSIPVYSYLPFLACPNPDAPVLPSGTVPTFCSPCTKSLHEKTHSSVCAGFIQAILLPMFQQEPPAPLAGSLHSSEPHQSSASGPFPSFP